jgi:DNA primase
MATDTQAIKDRLDIAQIVGEYVQLKKAGANWKANCPFHHEKSPSFMVHPEKQIWHCFGCGKGGDVFSFVQEMEGLDFVEALKLLARRAGVEVSLDRNEMNSSVRNRLIEINAAAATFFHRFLLELPAAESARKYLEQRGMKKQTIIDWQVGFIPEQWDLLTKYLVKKGHSPADLVTAGLTIQREGADPQTGRGYYDRFRGRVMFPISDTHGNIVGFTGRVLVESETSGGKYVNTPETPLYEKSRILYGIHRAKTEIKAKDLSVLVEGQMDVIACHQAGMTNVVAASGTALTSEQVKLFKRYSNNIAMAFDADSAGQKAGERGIAVAMEQGMNIRVIRIPEGAGKDADECLKKDPAVWFSAVKNATGVMDWYFDIHLSGIDKSNFTSKQKVASLLLTEIARIPNGVERDEWLKKLSDQLAIDPVVLREELKKVKLKPASNRIDKAPIKQEALLVKSPLELLGEQFWSLLLKNLKQYESIAKDLQKAYFKGTSFLPLYESLNTLYNRQTKLSVEEIKTELQNTGGDTATVDLLLLKPDNLEEEGKTVEAAEELQNLLQRIRSKWKEIRGREIQKELSEAEKKKDSGKFAELLSELQTLQST